MCQLFANFCQKQDYVQRQKLEETHVYVYENSMNKGNVSTNRFSGYVRNAVSGRAFATVQTGPYLCN